MQSFLTSRDGHNMLIRTRNHYYSTDSSKRVHSRQHSKGPHSSTYPCLPIAVTIRLTVWAILSFSIIINIIPSLALRGWKRKVVYYCFFFIILFSSPPFFFFFVFEETIVLWWSISILSSYLFNCFISNMSGGTWLRGCLSACVSVAQYIRFRPAGKYRWCFLSLTNLCTP